MISFTPALVKATLTSGCPAFCAAAGIEYILKMPTSEDFSGMYLRNAAIWDSSAKVGHL